MLPNITAAQLGQLRPKVLEAVVNARPLYYGVEYPVQRLTTAAIQGITQPQMAVLPPFLFAHFSLDQLKAFTATQRSWMTAKQKAEVSALVKHQTPPATDDDHPVTDDDHTTDDDHHSHHDDDHHSSGSPKSGGLSGGAVAGIVFAALFVVGAAGGVFWMKVVRPRGGLAGLTGGTQPDGYARMDGGV